MGELRETEEVGATQAIGTPVPKKPYDFLEGYERPLAESEALSAASFRFLVAEVRKKEGEIDELKLFREKYHEASEICAELRAAGKPNKIIDVIGSVCLASGSLLLGLASKSTDYSHVSLIFAISVVLVVAGMGAIMARAIRSDQVK